MTFSELDAKAPSSEAMKAELAASSLSPTLDILVGIAGRRSFAVATLAGFCLGFVALSAGRNETIGALIAFGALCIAAVAARRALAMQARVETLQQRLLDEASYHAFVDSAIEGFFRTTRNGAFLIVNPALARIYGYDSPEQLRTELTDIGQSLYVDPNRRSEFQELMAQGGMVHDFISQIRRRDGSVIWIAENARTVTDEDGQFLFYEGTVEDITVQRESEEATRRALIETQEGSRAKAAFLAAMSHELKTPLNAVIGFSDLMRQELFGPVNEPRYVSYIAHIYDNGRHLLAMINDILDLSRVESRLLDIEDDSVCVHEAVTAAWNTVIVDKASVAPIAIDVPPDLPMLRADPRRLHQILTHLLSNAAKFTPSEGRIEVRASRSKDGGIAIVVQDTGIGMEPDRIGHALEPFKQLDSQLSRRFEGVGLGLPLANALARLHGARLSIESMPAKGTAVTIDFPPARTLELAGVARA